MEVGCGVGVGSVTWIAGSLDAKAETDAVLFDSALFVEGSLSAISSSVTSGVECSTVMSTSDELLDPGEPSFTRCAMSVSTSADGIKEG